MFIVLFEIYSENELQYYGTEENQYGYIKD